MTEYEAVVYDLDGTLVHLDVDWDAVAREVIDVYERAGAPVRDGDLWRLLDDAPDHGIESEVSAAIAEFEHAGARDSRRLPLAAAVADHEAAVGVCSLNCEGAVRAALETHDLTDHVEAVVGRDTVDARKPDPEPLLETLDRVGAAPERSLFVGDSARDATAAERAGTDFEYVRDRV